MRTRIAHNDKPVSTESHNSIISFIAENHVPMPSRGFSSAQLKAKVAVFPEMEVHIRAPMSILKESREDPPPLLQSRQRHLTACADFNKPHGRGCLAGSLSCNAKQKNGRISNTTAVRESQRHFLSKRLSALRKMSPREYEDCFVRPALQYFLATLCDLRVNPEQRQRLGARYPHTPEVKRLLKKIEDEKPITASEYQLNALLSALKEILGNFPGGIFVDVSEEFYQISISSRLQITVVYLHGLLDVLPYFLRQFVYLICRSLRNVVSQCSGTEVDSYTDLLLMFTPVLFPSSVGDLDRFLRAARLTLVMVDCCEQVFQPVVWLDHNGNVWKPLSDEESFFYQILASLDRLEATLNDDSDEEWGNSENTENAADLNLTENGLWAIEPANQAFYQFAYLESNN